MEFKIKQKHKKTQCLIFAAQDRRTELWTYRRNRGIGLLCFLKSTLFFKFFQAMLLVEFIVQPIPLFISSGLRYLFNYQAFKEMVVENIIM